MFKKPQKYSIIFSIEKYNRNRSFYTATQNYIYTNMFNTFVPFYSLTNSHCKYIVPSTGMLH